MYFCISVFVTLAYATSNLKSLSHEINYKEKMGARNNHEKKILTHEIPTRKSFGPTNTHEKFWTHDLLTRKKFRPKKYLREKKFRPTKYPREKILDPQNTRKGTVARWHETHKTHNSTRPTKFSTLRQVPPGHVF